VTAPDGIHAETAGDGPAVVLVHAGICDSGMWDAQWGALADGRRLMRFDMRGFGRSPVPSAAYSHARDLIAVMDAAGISEAAIVGASMGGRVALEAALAAPARVSALVLVGSGLPGHEWSAPVRKYWEAEEAAIERGDLAAATEDQRPLLGRRVGPSAGPGGRRRARPRPRDAAARARAAGARLRA
jgi:3-oxoadipate enol-lactonase